MALLAGGTVASFASADKPDKTASEFLLQRCCTESAVNAETGEVIVAVMRCGGDSDAEYILTCLKAKADLEMLMKAPE